MQRFHSAPPMDQHGQLQVYQAIKSSSKKHVPNVGRPPQRLGHCALVNRRDCFDAHSARSHRGRAQRIPAQCIARGARYGRMHGGPHAGVHAELPCWCGSGPDSLLRGGERRHHLWQQVRWEAHACGAGRPADSAVLIEFAHELLVLTGFADAHHCNLMLTFTSNMVACVVLPGGCSTPGSPCT